MLRVLAATSPPLVGLAFRERRGALAGNPFDRPVKEVLSTPNVSDSTRMYRLVRPVVFAITPDPETAHRAAIVAGQVLGYWYRVQDRSGFDAVPENASRMHTCVGGVDLRSPVGLAAGFDKNAKLVDFFLLNPFSIAHAEMGSFSLHPWAGNPRPRLFRVPELFAIINRMGLNNQGAEVVANRLSESLLVRRRAFAPVLGVNITKTPDPGIEHGAAVEDFSTCFDFVKNIENLKWVTLNISCPNTAEGKTFEDPGVLDSLLGSLRRASGQGPKLFLKLAPLPPGPNDHYNAHILVSVAKKHKVDALVIANTVPDRDCVEMSVAPLVLSERGGLSGPPIFERSQPLVRLAHDSGMDVIAVGGISSGKNAFSAIQNGAKAVQLYTAMVYDGPGIFQDIYNGLERELLIRGYDKLADALFRMLNLSLHKQYLANLLVSSDEPGMSSFRMESTRMGGMYWGLSAMLLLRMEIDERARSKMIKFILSCYDEKSGGFGWSSGHDAHITATHYGLLIAKQLGHSFEGKIREGIVRFVLEVCVQPNGSVHCDKWGECDLRFSYDAACILVLIGAGEKSLIHTVSERMTRWIFASRNTDGAFGPRPNVESHAAYTFCAIAALKVLGEDIEKKDHLARWLSERQTPSGGFNGRPEKAPDVCYSWWILSTLEVLGRSDWICAKSLREFIIRSQDAEDGGIADRPDCVPDVFHTFFGLAALSLLGEPGLDVIDPVLAIVDTEGS